MPTGRYLRLISDIVAIFVVFLGVAYRYVLYHPHAPQLVLAALVGKKPFFTPDPIIGWVPTADLDQQGKDPDGVGSHLFQTDSRGLRSPEPIPGFDGNRIVLLGDSMVWGMGVDQSRIAGSLLRKRLGEAYEVVVAGTPGWSTDQEYLFFKSHIQTLYPDVVIWFITPINDVINNMVGQASSGVMYRKPRFIWDGKGGLQLLPIDTHSTGQRLREGLEENRSSLNFFKIDSDESFRDGVKLTGAILSQGRDEWSKQGIDVYCVMFRPTLRSRDSLNYSEYAKNHGYNPDDFSYEAALEHVRSMAESGAIDLYFFDTQPEMMFHSDHHLNVDGHVALTEFIERLLKGQVVPRWQYAKKN